LPLLALVLNQGPFAPPALPGLVTTTGPSATRRGPACPSRGAGRGHAPHRVGFPCSGRFPRHACHRHYPGGTDRSQSLLLLRSAAAFPAMRSGRLPHCTFRGLLGVHSRYGLHACWVASCDPLSSECFSAIRYLLSPLRLLPAGATSCRVGLSPTGNRRLCTAHRIARISWRI